MSSDEQKKSQYYISDYPLYRRIKEYIKDHKNPESIIKDDLVEELRLKYKEYGRRQKSAFRASVIRNFKIALEKMNTDESEPLNDSATPKEGSEGDKSPEGGSPNGSVTSSKEKSSKNPEQPEKAEKEGGVECEAEASVELEEDASSQKNADKDGPTQKSAKPGKERGDMECEAEASVELEEEASSQKKTDKDDTPQKSVKPGKERGVGGEKKDVESTKKKSAAEAGGRKAGYEKGGPEEEVAILSENSDEPPEELDEDEAEEEFLAELEEERQAASRNRESMPRVSYIQSVRNMTNSSRLNQSSITIISSDEEDDEAPKRAYPNIFGRNGPVDIQRIHPNKNAMAYQNYLRSRYSQRPHGGGGGTLTIQEIQMKPTKNSPKKRARDDIEFPLAKRIRSITVSAIPNASFKLFGGISRILQTVSELVMHLKASEVYRCLGVRPPRGFILHGPPGCGKSLLAQAIAGELEVPMIRVAGPELVAGVSGESESRIRELFDSALAQAPCVLFIDEIDAICPPRETARREMERRIVAQLLTCIDGLGEAESGDKVVVIGATNRLEALDPALRRAGRFDREVCLGIPDRGARREILQVLTQGMKLRPDLDLEMLAAATPGFVGADLKALTSEAAIAAVNRSLESEKKRLAENTVVLLDDTDMDTTCDPNETIQDTPKTPTESETTTNNENSVVSVSDTSLAGTPLVNGQVDEATKEKSENKKSENKENSQTIDKVKVADVQLSLLKSSGSLLTEAQLDKLFIEKEDFDKALKSVQPSAKREGFATVPDVSWEDIGSLKDVRSELEKSIMMPVKYPEEFALLGISAPTGILLCGPPGCGKTLVAKAVANEANINFISVKGPELLNMYVGESERAVRQCFQRAKNSQPCVIFFDEIDALCPKRSSSAEGSSASSRVVNQVLTEMDGVEGRLGVYLMAATNRPDMVDPAVLRPGRLDKILYVGLPSPADRADILRAITKNGTKPRLQEVDLEAIGRDPRLEGYTGADLAALIKEASLLAFEGYIQAASRQADQLLVSADMIYKAADKIRPSVPPADRRHYESLKDRLYGVPKRSAEEKPDVPKDSSVKSDDKH